MKIDDIKNIVFRGSEGWECGEKMKRYFNTEGQCNPQLHYMVNISERLKIIKERYVERGNYFIINRGRQYGKTTTLWLLEEYLQTEYFVLFLDFQELTTASFRDEPNFVKGLIRCLAGALEDYQDNRKFAVNGDIWAREGITEAVKILLKSTTTLFDSMIKQLDIYRELRNIIEQILYQGRRITFSPAEKSINPGLMFGFLKEESGHVMVANRIFEMYLLDLFMAEESVRSDIFLYGQGNKSQFIQEGRLNMDANKRLYSQL